MKFRIKSIIVITILILLVLLAVSMLSYVYYSRNNPYVWEIIIASIMVSLLLGVISKFIDKLFEKPIASNPITCLIGTTICLLVLISLLVYLSNRPKRITAEIPVTYLMNLKTAELASGIAFNDDTALICYWSARSIFKNFNEKNPDNAKLFANTDPNSIMFGFRCFHDLTEYLVFYYMSSASMIGFEREVYWKQTGDWEVIDWEGLPEISISGHPMPIDCITGDFKNNLFYGIKGIFGPYENTNLTLPKGTEISLVRKDRLTSQFTIQDNKYFKITIGVRLLGTDSLGSAFLDESAVLPNEDIGPFSKFNAVIYYKASFSKWRYAFSDMQYYEKWANSLFSVLQRKFAWGKPVLLDYAGIRRLEKRYDKNTSTNEN
jgi:hypothetical protein